MHIDYYTQTCRPVSGTLQDYECKCCRLFPHARAASVWTMNGHLQQLQEPYPGLLVDDALSRPRLINLSQCSTNELTEATSSQSTPITLGCRTNMDLTLENEHPMPRYAVVLASYIPGDMALPAEWHSSINTAVHVSRAAIHSCCLMGMSKFTALEA